MLQACSMDSYCAHCGTLHAAGLSPLLCEQRRRGAVAVYGRVLAREEVAGSDRLEPPLPGPTSKAQKIETASPEKTGGAKASTAEFVGGLAERLAATEKRLAELRASKAARMRRWRAKKKGK